MIYRNPDNVHPPLGSYSHQVEITKPVRWLVISGQVGQSSEGHLPADPLRQLDIALENITKNLKAAQMDISNIVKLTFYLVGDIDNQQRRQRVDHWLAEHRPTTTLLYVAALAAPGLRVEIEAWACQETH